MQRWGGFERRSETAVMPEAPGLAPQQTPQSAKRDMPVPAQRATRAGGLMALRARMAPHLAISLGALLGAPARYLVSGWAVQRWGSAFPFGTLLINVTGSLLLGFYLTLVTERFSGRPAIRLFVATGFLGSYTTFSTFSVETLRLLERGDLAGACANAAVSLLLTLAAVLTGILAARAL